jgi:hypothetical protein
VNGKDFENEVFFYGDKEWDIIKAGKEECDEA